MNKFRTTAGILLFCADLGWGADFTWIGGPDDPWGDPANWLSTPPEFGFPGYDIGASLPRDDSAIFLSSAVVSLPNLVAAGDLGNVTIQLDNDSVTVMLNGPALGAAELNLSELRVMSGSQLKLTAAGKWPGECTLYGWLLPA